MTGIGLSLAFLLLLFTNAFVFSQSEKKEYLDEFGFPSEQGNSKSYRVVTSDPTEPGKFSVKEYYMNDSIKQAGTFLDKEIFTKDGFFVEFYPNGQRSEEGLYTDNLKTGKWTKWYKNGQIREESFWYSSKDFDKQEKIENVWDSLGNMLASNGNGEYILDDSNPLIYTKGPLKGGLKNGKYTGYFKNGSIAFEENYSNNKLVKGISYDPSGKQYKYDKVQDSNLMPLYEFIGKNLRYPPDARRNGVQGKVVIQILFGIDGEIVKSRIVKGIGSGCDEEALRVIRLYNDSWDDGKTRGQSIKTTEPHSRFLPISFRLG